MVDLKWIFKKENMQQRLFLTESSNLFHLIKKNTHTISLIVIDLFLKLVIIRIFSILYIIFCCFASCRKMRHNLKLICKSGAGPNPIWENPPGG